MTYTDNNRVLKNILQDILNPFVGLITHAAR
jgi:hypothetical protein